MITAYKSYLLFSSLFIGIIIFSGCISQNYDTDFGKHNNEMSTYISTDPTLQDLNNDLLKIKNFGSNINCNNTDDFSKTFIKIEISVTENDLQWFPSLNKGRIIVGASLKNNGCTEISPRDNIDLLSFVVYNNTIVSSSFIKSIWGGKSYLAPAFPNDLFFATTAIPLNKTNGYYYTENKGIYTFYLFAFINNTLVGGESISETLK